MGGGRGGEEEGGGGREEEGGGRGRGGCASVRGRKNNGEMSCCHLHRLISSSLMGAFYLLDPSLDLDIP